MCLGSIGSFVLRKRTADMAKQVIGGAGERLKVCSGISQERLKGFAMMIMCDHTA